MQRQRRRRAGRADVDSGAAWQAVAGPLDGSERRRGFCACRKQPRPLCSWLLAPLSRTVRTSATEYTARRKVLRTLESLESPADGNSPPGPVPYAVHALPSTCTLHFAEPGTRGGPRLAALPFQGGPPQRAHTPPAPLPPANHSLPGPPSHPSRPGVCSHGTGLPGCCHARTHTRTPTAITRLAAAFPVAVGSRLTHPSLLPSCHLHLDSRFDTTCRRRIAVFNIRPPAKPNATALETTVPSPP